VSTTIGPVRPSRPGPAPGRDDGEPGEPGAGGGLRDSVVRLIGLLDRPLTSYYLIIGCTLLLLALGLALVLSTSSAEALDSGGHAVFGDFQKQLLGAVGGLVLMWLGAKASPRLYRAAAYPLMGLSVLGLLLVLAIGVSVGGGQRWIVLFGFQIQPSELAKLAFVLWGSDLLARKERLGQLTDLRQLLIPLLPGAAILTLLVMLGDDLGTTLVLLTIFLALLWIIGTPGRLFLGLLGMMAFVVLILIIVEPYRLARLDSFLGGGGQAASAAATTTKWQLDQGKDALGSGGLFGVGLGGSKAKWGYVPNSPNDWIFAILGEELGLVGTVCVVFLYGGLAYAGLRIARRVPDTFMRLAAAAATAWIVGEAVINIGTVLGLLPVTGIPLPLVSYGLSSLLSTMVALGMLLCFARHEPGAAQALAAAGPGVPRRILSWLGLGAWRQ
jgi:cell division protein FtsW